MHACMHAARSFTVVVLPVQESFGAESMVLSLALAQHDRLLNSALASAGHMQVRQRRKSRCIAVRRVECGVYRAEQRVQCGLQGAGRVGWWL